MSQHQPFDTTIKSIFKEDAAEILPHLLPGVAVVEVLDIEILRPPMRTDRVYRVLYKGKPHILEVEVQAGADVRLVTNNAARKCRDSIASNRRYDKILQRRRIQISAATLVAQNLITPGGGCTDARQTFH